MSRAERVRPEIVTTPSTALATTTATPTVFDRPDWLTEANHDIHDPIMRPRIPGGEPGGEVIMSTARFIIGDTRDVVASMADNSVDLVMTSPP